MGAMSAISDIDRRRAGRSLGVDLVRVSLTFPTAGAEPLRVFSGLRDYSGGSQRRQAKAAL
jgi:hypothetical protein